MNALSLSVLHILLSNLIVTCHYSADIKHCIICLKVVCCNWLVLKFFLYIFLHILVKIL